MRQIVVRAEWDDEAQVWVATSDDVPGLITEAGSRKALEKKLAILIPELLEANGVIGDDCDDIPYQLLSQANLIAKRHAC